MLREIRLSSLCKAMGLQYVGRDMVIHGLNLCDRQSVFDRVLSYATSGKYAKNVRESKHIACLILREADMGDYDNRKLGRKIAYIITPSPEKSFYQIHQYLYEKTDFYERYDFKPRLGEQCEIDPTAVIEDGVAIGNRVKIGAMSVIRKGSVIGDDTTIGGHTIIGGEGFQVLRIDGENWKIPHVGGCRIGQACHIGAHTIISNSLFETATRIGNYVMIDNFVQIAHNVEIEDSAVLTAGVVLAGSCRIGKSAWIAPNATITNKVTVGGRSMVGIGSVAIRNVKANSTVFGVPAIKF